MRGFEDRLAGLVLKLIGTITALILSVMFAVSLTGWVNALYDAKQNPCEITNKYIQHGFLGLGGAPAYYITVETNVDVPFWLPDRASQTSISVTESQYESLKVGDIYAG